MKLGYKGDGLVCEFVLMTVGEKTPTRQQTRQVRGKRAEEVRPVLDASSTRGSAPTNETMLPPPDVPPDRPVARNIHFEMRPPPIPPSTLRSESLFVPQDEARWEPVNPDEDDGEEEQARLDWDASHQTVKMTSSCPKLQARSPFVNRICVQNPSSLRLINRYDAQPGAHAVLPEPSASGLEPTQRLSEASSERVA